VVHSDSQAVLEIISTALERMAFLAVEPVDGCPPAPADPVLVRVPLRLPRQAAVEMIAPESLGAMIAANALALKPGEAASPQQAHDALSEFLNILASAMLLPDSAIVSAGEIMKGVPQVTTTMSEINWGDFIAHESTVLFGVEGSVAACRMITESK
jgi:hypothetical protein